MTLVGDLRDLSKEGSKFVVGEEYHKFILGISTLGVGLSVSQVLTAGASTPLKVGASTVKFAKKSGKLTKSFLKLITSKLNKSINFKALKKVDFTSISKLKKLFIIFAKTIDFSHTNKLFEKVSKLKKNTSSIDSISLLKYVDKEKDLNKVVKLSNKFGKNTRGVFKVLGKKVLKAGKVVIKYTSLLIFELFSLVISFFSLIFMFIYKRILFKKSKIRFFKN